MIVIECFIADMLKELITLLVFLIDIFVMCVGTAIDLFTDTAAILNILVLGACYWMPRGHKCFYFLKCAHSSLKSGKVC